MKTQADPKQWIKNKILSSQDQDSWRTSSKEVKQKNNQIDNAINEKSNLKIYNTHSLGLFNLNFQPKLINRLGITTSKNCLSIKLPISFVYQKSIRTTGYFCSKSSSLQQKLILQILGYGNIFIITNANEGWIQQSSKLYSVFQADIYLKLIKSLIKIQQKLSLLEMDMKINIQEIVINGKFKLLMKSKKTLIFRQFYFVSDSHIQMDAAHILGKQFNQPLIKTIKFKQHPRPEELIKQQELVFQRFQQIYMSIKNLKQDL